MISLILLKLFTFSQILQGVPKLSHATVYIYIYIYIYIYSSQHLKWIQKVHQSCPKTRNGYCFCFRTTLMKGFDPLQMLTTFLILIAKME